MLTALKNFTKEKLPWVVTARNKFTMGYAYVRYYALIVYYRIRYPKESVFETIHKRRTWGTESSSGGGSDLEQTESTRKMLPVLLKKVGARSMLDAPCGDFHWMSHIVADLDSYVGCDIVPELIERNSENYASDKVRFVSADITKDPLPRADVILCRDCMVHLSYADAFNSLRNLKRSGSTYLLATTYPGLLKRNWNIITGMWKPLDLQLAPYSFPEPIELVNENSTETTDYPQKSLGLWKLDDLPF